MAALRGGTAPGTWVHAVLEHLDFQTGAARDGRPLAELVAEEGEREGIRDPEQHAILVEHLPRVLATPLDGAGLPAGFALADLPAADRLDELRFDLRLGAGLHHRYRHPSLDRRLDPAAAAAALRAHGDPDWPGRAWLEALLAREDAGASVLPRVAGFLTGAIDLVLRVGDRYWIADYKTNRLGPAGRRQDGTLGHYTRPWLAHAMAHHGYHLQALVYTVALHRFLRARLGEDYDYDRCFGGHLYLFLRGMVGPETPAVDGARVGVWADRWPRAVVEGLDAALDGAKEVRP